MSENECRDAFESSIDALRYPLQREPDGSVDDYFFPQTQAAWEGFQAAWNTRPASGVGVESDVEALVEALEWYIENDDVCIGQEGNEFYEDGYYRAKTAIAKFKKGV